MREVADYFGLRSPHYELIDLSEDRAAHQYQRGYGHKYRAAHYDRLREYYRKWLAANRKSAAGVAAKH